MEPNLFSGKKPDPPIPPGSDSGPVEPSAAPAVAADVEVEPAAVPFAWQPLTPRGVAAFAHATLSRLFLVELMVALMVAASLIWFFGTEYSPAITAATQQLPEGAALKEGRLNGVNPGPLATGKYFALIVDLDETGEFGRTADVQLEFGRTNFYVSSQLSSLLGFLQFDYPVEKTIPLGRSTAEPWWGAWKSMLIPGAALLAVPVLFLSWACLATLYFLPVRLMAFFLDRKVTVGGCWRLASAAQLPGALFVTSAIVLYGLQVLDLVRLLIFWGLHLVIGWIYLVAAPFALPKIRSAATAKQNPFSGAGEK